MNALDMLAYFGQYLWVGLTIHQEQTKRPFDAYKSPLPFLRSVRTVTTTMAMLFFSSPEAFICERNSESDRFAILQPTDERSHRSALHEFCHDFTYYYCHFVAIARQCYT